jgi:hypothetical protein
MMNDMVATNQDTKGHESDPVEPFLGIPCNKNAQNPLLALKQELKHFQMKCQSTKIIAPCLLVSVLAKTTLFDQFEEKYSI